MLGIIILTSLLQAHFLLWPDFSKAPSAAVLCPCPAPLHALHAPLLAFGSGEHLQRDRGWYSLPSSSCSQHLQGSFVAEVVEMVT